MAETDESVYINVINFNKAVDSVYRRTMWNILKQFGTPGKYINTIKLFYDNCTARVEHYGNLYITMNIKQRFGQGCIVVLILNCNRLDDEHRRP